MKRNLLATAVGLLLASSAHCAILEWSLDESHTYQENKEALEFRCKIAAQDAFQEMRQTYYLPSDDEVYVYQLMLERETRKATYDYICDTPWQRVENKKRIDDLYQDSIDVRLLPHNDNMVGQTISLSLRMTPKIGVNADNYNKIMRLGLMVCKHLRKNPRYNYDVEVMDSLRNYMTKKQLYEVLASKYTFECFNKSVTVWNNLKNAGLTENEDSALCCIQAFEYYIMESVINEMFIGHEKQLKKNLSDLWKKQPLIVRMDGAVKKKEALVKKKEEEDNNNEMVW